MAAKKVKLSELLGKVEEEEPKGEVLSERSSGSTSFLKDELTTLCLPPCEGTICSFSFLLHALIYLQSFILSFLDESTEGEMAGPLTKEEEEVETMRSWIKVGGFPAQPEGEAKAVLMEVGPPSCIYLPSA